MTGIDEIREEFRNSSPARKIHDMGLVACLIFILLSGVAGSLPGVFVGAVGAIGNHYVALNTSFQESDSQ